MDKKERAKRESESFRPLPPPGFEYIRGAQAQAAISWLNGARLPRRLTAVGLAGSGFPAYARVDYPVIEEILDPSEIDAHFCMHHTGDYARLMADPHEKDIGRLLIGATNAPFPFRRVRLHEMAERLGIPYSANFYMDLASRGFTLHNRQWLFPLGIFDTWGMPRQTIRQLVKLLGPFVEDQLCFFNWCDEAAIGLPLFVPDNGFVVFRASLDDLMTTVNVEDSNLAVRAPDLWWPPDHKWVVSSDFEHCNFTVVGGPKRLISKILADRFLDAIEVKPEQELHTAYDASTAVSLRERERLRRE
jgi:hypothetical protein